MSRTARAGENFPGEGRLLSLTVGDVRRLCTSLWPEIYVSSPVLVDVGAAGEESAGHRKRVCHLCV